MISNTPKISAYPLIPNTSPRAPAAGRDMRINKKSTDNLTLNAQLNFPEIFFRIQIVPAIRRISVDAKIGLIFFRSFPILRICETSGKTGRGCTPSVGCRRESQSTGGYTMCDYSLQGLPNRLAVEGEQLITHRFRTGSMGLATPTDIAAANCPKPQAGCRRPWWSVLKQWLDPEMQLDQVPAVCIPPGAQLFMNHIPEGLMRKFALQAVEDVTFVQLSAEAHRYRDGIQFRNGEQV
jgi:hypothetical protein